MSNGNTVNHCKDCCCARSWEALGITVYTGKSIPEHIVELQVENRTLKNLLLNYIPPLQYEELLAEITKLNK